MCIVVCGDLAGSLSERCHGRDLVIEVCYIMRSRLCVGAMGSARSYGFLLDAVVSIVPTAGVREVHHLSESASIRGIDVEPSDY
jgi:hypothetical protein